MEVKQRLLFATVQKGSEEAEIDPECLTKMRVEEELLDSAEKDEVEAQSKKVFASHPRDVLLSATTFSHQCKPNCDPVIWSILEAGEEIEDCNRFPILQERSSNGPTTNLVRENCAKRPFRVTRFFLSRTKILTSHTRQCNTYLP